MFIKKLTLKSVLFNLLLVMPIFSFAAISVQDMVNFKNIYGSEIKPETYTKILSFCNKNDTDIYSCLLKLKAKSSEQKSAANAMGYSQCCWNVSGQWGEYVFVYGQSYCVYPCGH